MTFFVFSADELLGLKCWDRSARLLKRMCVDKEDGIGNRIVPGGFGARERRLPIPFWTTHCYKNLPCCGGPISELGNQWVENSRTLTFKCWIPSTMGYMYLGRSTLWFSDVTYLLRLAIKTGLESRLQSSHLNHSYPCRIKSSVDYSWIFKHREPRTCHLKGWDWVCPRVWKEYFSLLKSVQPSQQNNRAESTIPAKMTILGLGIIERVRR